VISGIARVRALRQALESSQTALKATEAGYEVGTRTAVDVLNSRRILVQAQTDYAVSRYDYIVSVIQLRLAAGNLSRADVAEVNKWLAVSAPTVPAQPIEPPASARNNGSINPATCSGRPVLSTQSRPSAQSDPARQDPTTHRNTAAQLISVVHNLRSTARNQQIGDIRTVGRVRARQDRQAQRCGLEQIVATIGTRLPPTNAISAAA